MKQGEKYQCTNEDCGCQISVTQTSQLEESELQNPTCCCGEEMELMETAGRGTGSRSRSRSE